MSFVVSLMPVFLGGFIFALITGIKAAIDIEKNPEKYKGKGFAIAGLILGSIGLVLAIILALMLMHPIQKASRNKRGLELKIEAKIILEKIEYVQLDQNYEKGWS